MLYPYPRPSRYALKVGRCATGLGLYAAEPIPKGRFIIEYWGRFVDDAEAERVGGRYLFGLGDDRNILGADRRNLARYANHSCRPNCEAHDVRGRVFIVSVKPIAAGEAITYDYGKDYFEGYIKPAGCQCEKCARKRSRRKTTSGRARKH